jgi:hypothetical protein
MLYSKLKLFHNYSVEHAFSFGTGIPYKSKCGVNYDMTSLSPLLYSVISSTGLVRIYLPSGLEQSSLFLQGW